MFFAVLQGTSSRTKATVKRVIDDKAPMLYIDAIEYGNTKKKRIL